MKKLSAICIILTLFWAGCEDTTEPEPDTTPPTIIITNPVDGTELTESVTIKVDVTDNEGVDMVEIIVDGESIGTVTAAPYDFDWNVSFWADGDVHSILAKATDIAGNVGTSDLISVTVSTSALSLTLVSPLANEIIRDTNVITTRWRTLTAAISYSLEVSTDPNFSVIAYSDSLADTTSTTTALTQSNHYWRVKGTNDIGEETEWSSVRSFLLDGPEAPGLINPTNDSLIIGVSTPTMAWNSSEFSTLFEVNASLTTNFSSNEFEGTTAETTLVTTALADGKHYWRVRAQNSVGFWGDWSSSRTFFLSDVIIFANTYDRGESASGYSVQETADGGYIITGDDGNFNTAMLLMKTDTEGNEDWARIFAADTHGNSVQQTADGGYIIVGSIEIGLVNGPEVWLIKVDATGLEQWNKTFRGSLAEEGKSVQQTSDGGYIITGSIWTSNVGGNRDVWLIKTDALGDTLWTKTFGGAGTEDGQSVMETVDGGYIIAGNKFDPTLGWLIKTDINGIEEWNKEFQGTESSFSSVEQTSDGGYILGGGENMQPRLLKTDVNGVEEWKKLFTEFSAGHGWSAVQTLDGGFILTGAVFPSSGTGLMLLKTDALGNEEWNKIYGEGNGGWGFSVQQASDGGYIITGRFSEGIWLIKTDSEGNTVL